MMQSRHFHRLFPLLARGTAKKIRALGFNTVQLDLAFKDIDLSTPGQITAEKAKKVRETFRDHDLPVCCHLGLHQHRPPGPGRARAAARLSQGDHPQRPPFRLALRDLRDRHLQHGIGLGAATRRTRPRKASRTAARSSPSSRRLAYDHGAVFLLETYVNNVVGSVEETVRMFARGRPSRPRPADGPDQLFRGPQHRPHGQGAEADLRHAVRHICIAHAKDVKRSERQEREARRHRRRPRPIPFRGVGEIELPAPGPGRAELRSLPPAPCPKSTRTSRSSSSISMSRTCRGRRSSWTASSAPTGCDPGASCGRVQRRLPWVALHAGFDTGENGRPVALIMRP